MTAFHDRARIAWWWALERIADLAMHRPALRSIWNWTLRQRSKARKESP